MMLRLLFIVITFIYVIESISLRSNTCDNFDKICKPVNCNGTIKNCPYGYQKQDECEICECYDPCNSSGKAILCEANQRCFVDKQSDGTFLARCDSLGSQKTKDVCKQEKVVGSCKASFPRFYYDLNMKKCKEFIYGGCGGNDNNFKTKDECEATCVNEFN